jgi:hypothetical protein
VTPEEAARLRDEFLALPEGQMADWIKSRYGELTQVLRGPSGMMLFENQSEEAQAIRPIFVRWKAWCRSQLALVAAGDRTERTLVYRTIAKWQD